MNKQQEQTIDRLKESIEIALKISGMISHQPSEIKLIKAYVEISYYIIDLLDSCQEVKNLFPEVYISCGNTIKAYEEYDQERQEILSLN